MATLVSPVLAVTSALAIDAGGSGPRPDLWLDFPLRRPELGKVKVSVEGYDNELDFAVLRLEKPLHVPSEPILSYEYEKKGKKWETVCFASGGDVGFPASGHVGGGIDYLGRRLVLVITNPPTSGGGVGAPVVVDGRVIAITLHQRPAAESGTETHWLAIPVSEMAASKSTDAIRRLLNEQEASGRADAFDGKTEPRPEQSESGSARTLLMRLKDADASLRAAAIHALSDELSSDPVIRAAVMARLEDGTNDVRRAAVQALSDLASHDTEVRAALMTRLEDQSNIVRRAAVKALRSLTADPQVEAAMKARLQDEDYELRTLASAVLTAAREATRAEEAKAPASVSVDQRIDESTVEAHPQSPELDRESFFRRLSPSSRRALSHAAGMRRYLTALFSSDIAQKMKLPQTEMDQLQEQTPQSIPLVYLIAGLFENEESPTRRLFFGKNIDGTRLASLIEQAEQVPMPSRLEYSPIKLDSLPPLLTPETVRALQAARDFADRMGSSQVQSRHLLYGALSIEDDRLVKLLAEAGVRRKDVPLTEAHSAPASVPASIAFVSADTSDGEDLLGFEPDVNALSKIIAAKDVEPPLSIGLFGDWGSGKSFFMRRMESRIKELTDIGRAARGKSAYCENVVHIWFNAWSYMDTDLWASLVTEIFEELAQAIDRDEALAGGMDPTTAKARLLAATASARDVLAEEEKKRDAAQTELEASEKRLEKLKATDEELEARLSTTTILKDAYRVIAREESIGAELEAAAKRLNIPKAQRAGQDLKVRLLEVGNTWSALRLALKGWNRPRTWLLPILVLAAVLVLLWVVVPKALDLHLDSAIEQAVKVVASITAALLPFLAKAERALSIIQRVKKSQHDRIEELRQEIEREPRKQQRHVKEKLGLAEKRVEQAREEVRKLEQLQEEMRADKQLSDFIRKRSLSTDYTSRLGTVARARRDFKHLSDLIDRDKDERQRNIGAKSGEQPAATLLPRIDRIVLYIDDLDRCAEDKVVKVLEAVHLLLAFRLFVVIVAVDSRWLLRSLRQHSAAFHDSNDGAAGISPEELSHWESTPLNYLEKIFQIPFYLSPMRESGFGLLVDAVVGKVTSEQREQAKFEEDVAKMSDDATHQPARAGQEFEDDSTQRTTPGETRPEAASLAGTDGVAGPGGNERAQVTGAALETGSAEAKQSKPEAGSSHESETPQPTFEEANPAALQLREWERNFMKRLHTLIGSPRSAKRFVNIYRLMRVSITDQTELTAFVGDKNGGPYRSALLLLAILTGYPGEATDILRDLLEEERPETWWQYIDGLEARWNSTVKPSSGSGSLGAQRRRDLMEKLKMLRGEIPDIQSCDQFVKWASKVARYSFESGRVLMLMNDEAGND